MGGGSVGAAGGGRPVEAGRALMASTGSKAGNGRAGGADGMGKDVGTGRGDGAAGFPRPLPAARPGAMKLGARG